MFSNNRVSCKDIFTNNLRVTLDQLDRNLVATGSDTSSIGVEQKLGAKYLNFLQSVLIKGLMVGDCEEVLPTNGTRVSNAGSFSLRNGYLNQFLTRNFTFHFELGHYF